MDNTKIKAAILHEAAENVGISKYITEVVKEIADHPNLDLYVITPRRINFENKKVKQMILRWPDIPYVGRISWMMYIYFKLFKYNFDLIHCPFIPGWFRIFPINFYKKVTKVLTLHDLMWRKKEMRGGYGTDWIAYFILLPLGERFADFLITISKNSQKEIVRIKKWPPERVYVTLLGVSENFRRVANKQILDSTRRKYNLPERFILNVGTIKPNKNIINIINAFAAVAKENRDIHLVFSGKITKSKYPQKVSKKIKSLPLDIKRRIKFLNFIPVEDLRALYSLAEIFCMPSFDEGFGMPVLEAMGCGVPVITSNVSCLPEVAGDAAILVNPSSSLELAKGIKLLLSDDNLKKKLVKKGYRRAKTLNWKRTAKETLKAYKAALKYKGNKKYKLLNA